MAEGSFFGARLHGAPLRVQRRLAIARAVLAATAAVTYFLDWHVVHATKPFEDLVCLFGSDCPPVSGGPPRATGAVSTCTGLSHYHGRLVAPALAMALFVLSLACLRRPRLGVAMLIDVAGIGLLVAMMYPFYELEHLFDRVEPLWAEYVFGSSFLLLLLLHVLGPFLQAWMTARSRRSVPDSLTETHDE